MRLRCLPFLGAFLDIHVEVVEKSKRGNRSELKRVNELRFKHAIKL